MYIIININNITIITINNKKEKSFIHSSKQLFIIFKLKILKHKNT